MPKVYAYTGNDPLDKTDPTGNCPECLGALVEIGFELYTGELQSAVSEASKGNFGAIAVSAAKVGIATVSAGVSTVAAAKAIGIAAKVSDAVNAGKVAATATKVAAIATAQAANGAATKVATNAVEGQPLDKGVGTAAAVGGTVGTAGSVAGNKIASTVGAEVGANAGTAAKFGAQVISGFAKKETNCSINNGNPC